ncbi:MAG: hypothetical protein KGH50_00290 [Candidatus Micrarchaeota archaeon]|nr:hypothetical protein [Candidatus Micrarchaeota archaeon]
MGQRLQSAMEYLITYGWAILAISIALGSLSLLGVFNADNYTPKQLAGSCYVQRNVVNVYLVGTCNKGLPKFVASFNGKNAYINLGNTATMSPEAGATGNMTLCLWYRIISTSNYYGPILKGMAPPSSGNGWEYTIDQQGGPHSFVIWNSGGANIAGGGSGKSNVANVWGFACFAYDYANSVAYYFYNATQYSVSFNGANGPASQKTGNLVVGAGEGPGAGQGYSNIQAANLQLYNRSLTQGQIYALYQEGIGGAPVTLQYLLGWWPMNGDAIDYSGNNNNGNAINVSWSTTWYNSYSPPISTAS